MTARLTDPAGAKQAQIITLQPPCLAAEVWCVFLYLEFAHHDHTSTLVLSIKKTKQNTVSEVL